MTDHREILAPPPAIRPIRCVSRRPGEELWQARHDGDGSVIAIKVRTARIAREAAWSRAFRLRQRAVARLGHGQMLAPLAVLAVDTGLAEATDGALPLGAPGVVLPWAAGGSLDPAEPLPWSALSALLDTLLDALGHAHARGVLHLDVTPGNLVFARAGARAAADLRLTGFALVEPAEGDAPELIGGTVGFTPPEQVDADWAAIGPWTDLYGVACTAWALLTGMGPFAAENRRATRFRQLSGDTNAFHPRVDVPAGLEGMLRRMLVADPAGRPGSAAAVRAALGRLGPPTPVAAPLDEPTARFDLEPSATEEAPRARLHAWRGAPAAPSPAGLPRDLPLARLREPPFIGRERERDLLWARLAAVQAGGAARLALIEGRPGSGRRRLGAWLASRAAELDVVDAVVRVHHDDGGPSGLAEGLRRWLRLDRAAPDEWAAAVTRALDRLGSRPDWLDADVAAWLHPAPTGPAAPAAALLPALLALAARSRPVLLVVDDIDRSPATAGAIGALLARQPAEPTPVLVVAIATAPASGAGAPALAALLDRTDADRLPLGPLSPPELQELVTWMHPVSPRTARELHRRSDGWPLAALQLAALLAEDPSGRTPASVDRAWEARLASVCRAPEDRALVERASALGMRAAREDLVRVWPGDLPADLAERLEDAGLATRTREGWRLAHETLRAAVLGGAARAGRLRAHHQACARSLAPGARGAPARSRVAAHHLAAGDATGAWRAAMDAAREAAAAGQTDHEAAALEIALAALESDGTTRGRRLIEARLAHAVATADAAGLPGDPATLVALATAARAAELVDLALLATRAWLDAGGGADAASALTALVGAASPDSDGLAEARFALANHHRAVGRPGIAEHTLRALEASGAGPALIARSRALRAAIALEVGDPVEAGAVARRLARDTDAPPDARARARGILGEIELLHDRPDEAERQWAAALPQARRAGAPAPIGEALLALAGLARRQGRVHEAVAQARAAGRWLAVGGRPAVRATVEEARAALRLGQPGDAAALLRGALERADDRALPAARAALACVAASTGDWLVFDTLLDELDDGLPRGADVSDDLMAAALHAHERGDARRAARARHAADRAR